MERAESIPNSNLTAGDVSVSISEFLKSAKPKTHRAFFDLFLNGYMRIACSLALFAHFPSAATYCIAFTLLPRGMGVLVNLAHEAPAFCASERKALE